MRLCPSVFEVVCKIPRCGESVRASSLKKKGTWIEDSHGSRCELVKRGVASSGGSLRVFGAGHKTLWHFDCG